MKKLFIYIFLITLNVIISAQTVITVNSQNDWPIDINGKTINVQRGINLTFDKVVIGINVTINAIGVGVKPVFVCKDINGGLNITGYVNGIDIIANSTTNVAKPAVQITGTIENCNVSGGWVGIMPIGTATSNVIIKNCKVTNALYDGINTLQPLNSVSIINTIVGDMNMLDGTDCNVNLSTDNIHMENVANVIIDGVYSDHSKYEGKFALILNKITKSVTVKNSTFIGWTSDDSGNAAVYFGIDKIVPITIDNTIVMGGLTGIRNFGNITAINMLVSGCKNLGIEEGFNNKFTNCTFENIGLPIDKTSMNAAYKAYTGNTATFTNCKFDNCNRNYATGAGMVIETNTNGIGSGATITLLKPTMPQPYVKINWHTLYNEASAQLTLLVLEKKQLDLNLAVANSKIADYKLVLNNFQIKINELLSK